MTGATTLALALGALAAPAIATGDDERRDRAATFEGSCDYSGVLRQRPPLTNTPQAGEGIARAAGTCTGPLTLRSGRVRQLDAAPAGYFARASGTLSCGGGSAAGRGFLRLSGAKLRFRFSEVRGPGAAAIRLEGARGGSATGAARVSEDEDPVEIARRCAGEGLRQVRIGIELATSPAISG